MCADRTWSTTSELETLRLGPYTKCVLCVAKNRFAALGACPAVVESTLEYTLEQFTANEASFKASFRQGIASLVGLGDPSRVQITEVRGGSRATPPASNLYYACFLVLGCM